MKQETFVQLHRADWEALGAWLVGQGARRQPGTAAPAVKLEDAAFPHLYREVCQHLALARARGYSPALVEQLQELVQDGHQLLYRAPRLRWRTAAGFFVVTFPRLVRRERRLVLLAAVLFFAPLLVMLWLIQRHPELAYSMLSAEQVAEFDRMYDNTRHTGRLARDSQTDLVMFGYYILNNVGIAFRTMASGLVAGIGSLFVLITNGLIIGTVAGHVTSVGFGTTFWSFVAGHSAPELLAIVISGAAGLRLGFALLAPGRRTRVAALREAGVVAAQLVLGAFAMLVFAAFVEAYWSSIAWIAPWIKYSVGAVLWFAILGWFTFGGRREA